MHRTIRLKLDTTSTQQAALLQTLKSFTAAFNFVCDYGWQHSEKASTRLHHATYYTVKGVVDLPSQLICAARVKAAEALKSTFTHLKLYPAKLTKYQLAKAAAEKKGKPFRRKEPRPPSCPKATLCPVLYDQRSYRLDWAVRTASLATAQGRVVVGFTIPPYGANYTGYPVDSADLLWRKGRFWLHVVVTMPTPDYAPSGETIGVDLGLNHPAVTSKRKFLGSRHWKEVDRRIFRLRGKLQSKGTKSAKRHLKKLAGRLIRFRRDCDHVISKRIVQSAESGATIVIENLTHIRSTTEQRGSESRRRFHSWSFAQFRSYLCYKAEGAGIQVVAIDPRYTSQTCSRCGYQSRSNRKSQSQFECGACNYRLNADLNASYNIRDKHHASLGISLAGGPQSIGLTHPPSGEVQAVCFS